MEYRPCRQASLCTTRFAVQNISRADQPSFIVSTLRTPKSIRPSHFPEMLRTSFFCGEFALKFNQTALLVSIGHFGTPDKSRVQYHLFFLSASRSYNIFRSILKILPLSVLIGVIICTGSPNWIIDRTFTITVFF